MQGKRKEKDGKVHPTIGHYYCTSENELKDNRNTPGLQECGINEVWQTKSTGTPN